MSAIKKLAPARGLRIPVPGKRRYLADEGERVRIDTYWQRRIDAGDVVEVAETSDAPIDGEASTKKTTKTAPKEP